MQLSLLRICAHSIRGFMRAAVISLPFAFAVVFLLPAAPTQLRAQSMLAGDIAGTVHDPSGAAIEGATVKAVSQETGAVSTTTTSATGAYRFSLLKPGTYKLTASKSGFKASTTTVTVAIGQIATQNLALSLGEASETIQVSAAPQLLQTDTAELTTTVSLEQLQDIPNPGSDITYVAQSRPGIVMNTGANSSSGTLGYGNFSAFGLPGTSNNFTINGMEVNDPFLNLNNSGPSNLLLGMNDIGETDVITNAYETQYGSLGGVQLNSVSRSGSNKFHGNFNYSWNGRAMNANDWFNKNPNFSSPAVARPFSNFNQWAAAVGGPIKRNKLFFFANTEGISFITASQSVTDLPSPAFEASVVGTNGTCSDSSSSLFVNSEASECAFYNHVFALYNGIPNYANATPVDSTGLDLQLSAPSRFDLTEKLITGRVDADFGPNDKAFVHFKYDHGVQPTYTDPINPAFDAESDQPDYEGQMAWTHTFGARAVNQFLLTGSWYSAIFKNVNAATELNTFPMELTWLDGFASDLNNDGLAWPEGRNVTQYQIGDDFSYTVGPHTFKTGFQFKKDDLSDYDTGILTTPLIFTDAGNASHVGGAFQAGQADGGLQNFTNSLDLPLSLYTLGVYFEDDYKPSARATITAGVRLERNSNVSCSRNCLSNFGGTFFNLAATSPLNDPNQPYNTQIKYGLSQAFDSYMPVMVEPRVGFTLAVTPKTVLRGGFGMFTDVFPGTIADTMLDNPPLTRQFEIFSPAPLNPSDPASYQALAAGADATFTSQFAAGSKSTACPVAGAGDLGSANCMAAVNPNFAPPSFTTVEGTLHYPTYDEFNLQIQQEFDKQDSIQIGYVGNRGYHEPNQNVGVNATGGPLSATPPAPSFGPITEVESEAISNFNGLIVTWQHQGHGLTSQVNYQWSHALDEISNGGILPFNATSIDYQINPYSLASQYGNADYDVRHYVSGNYLYMMPHLAGPSALTGGWQVGGTIFWNSGNPFTPVQYVADNGIGNYGNGQNVMQIAPLPGVSVPHHCGPSSANTPCLNPADFAAYSNNGATVPFGAYDRNQFFGPHFFNTDMTLMKGFHLAHLGEASKLEVGATAFNLLNHPNFGLPSPNIDAAHFAQSLYMEGPPTSIYGSGVGGDPSIRILELNGKIVF